MAVIKGKMLNISRRRTSRLVSSLISPASQRVSGASELSPTVGKLEDGVRDEERQQQEQRRV